MGHLKEPESGCRPDQLFGVWAIEDLRFTQMVSIAKEADVAALRAQAAAAADERNARPLYNTTQDGIAVIEVNGPMTKYETSFQSLFGGTSTLRARKAIRSAVRDPEVVGIMLRVDSPGGTVGGTSDLADDIRAADARKPVFSYADDLMCSAAMWVGSGARQIFANKTASVGSIGVYSVVYDESGRAAAQNVKVHVISSAPPIKGAGVAGTEITGPQLAEFERQVKELADLFVSELASGRRMSKEKAQSLATGQVWVASKAHELGLIDGVVSFDEAMSRLKGVAMEEKDLHDAKARAEAAEARASEEKAKRELAERAAAETKARLDALEGAERGRRFGADAAEIKAPEAFGAVLDEIERKAGAETYGKVLTQLKAMAEQVKTGKLFEEKGSPGAGGSGSALERLDGMAKALVAEGKQKDYATAYAVVCKLNPELVSQTRPSGKEA